MKIQTKLFLLLVAILTSTKAVEAKTVIPPEPLIPIVQTLKTGSWTIFYYQGPNERNITSTSSFCVHNNNTWNISGPIISGVYIPGNGGWSREGQNIIFYGMVGEAIQGAAFSAIGQLVGETLITGRYVNFNLDQRSPNGVYGSFKATFQGNVCPF